MNEVFDEYYLKIYHWVLKKTRNKEEAEDLTNNVFVAVFEYFNKNIKVEKIENLVWKIAQNIWYANIRKYVKEENNVDYDSVNEKGYYKDTLEKIIYKDIVNNLDNINLTKMESLAFRLYYCNGFSVKEISEKLNSSVSNIKYYLYSARKKIKEEYND